MATRGPKPKPAVVKALSGSGNVGNHNPPEIDATAPDCPAWLDADAQACWRDIVPQLAAMGILGRIDANSLSRYCQDWARWKRAEMYLAEHGNTYKLLTKDGDLRCYMQFPEVAIAHRLSIALTKLESEFGMTPSARTRINVTPKPAANPLTEFLTNG